MAMKVRPSSAELAGVVEGALDSADTVVFRKGVEVESTGDAKPLPGAEGVLHRKGIDAAERPERHSITPRDSDQCFPVAHPVSGHARV
jgi:hypothetical protein